MNAPDARFLRKDVSFASDPGIDICVRHFRRTGEEPDVVPLLLVHGGGPGSLTSFDLPVPGFSVAEDLAAAGHDVYVMDIRGWGASTRPPELDQPADANPPAVTHAEAARDISAVVTAMRERHQERKVALPG